MAVDPQLWLSREELVFFRMRQFHQERVKAFAAEKRLGEEPNGVLMLHLIPQETVERRIQLPAADLNKHAATLPGLGGSSLACCFNVDGLCFYQERKPAKSYSQLFRDGRIEAACADIYFRQYDVSVVRDAQCERAFFDFIPSYLKLCQALALNVPIWAFVALVGCDGARFRTNPHFPDFSPGGVDRSIAFLPELKIEGFDIEPQTSLRPLCDFLWQAGGIERSLNFDAEGKWRGRG
ncbi:MAG TPA: hypothetical protein VHC22_32350 [Pirellulales bacterium]|nr:hypothetical protein [Pirellulales bacterium]